MMKAARTSKTQINLYHSRRHNTTKDSHLHFTGLGFLSHSLNLILFNDFAFSENQKSYTFLTLPVLTHFIIVTFVIMPNATQLYNRNKEYNLLHMKWHHTFGLRHFVSTFPSEQPHKVYYRHSAIIWLSVVIQQNKHFWCQIEPWVGAVVKRSLLL